MKSFSLQILFPWNCAMLSECLHKNNLTWFFDDYYFTVTKHDDLLVATDVIFDLANTSDWGGILLSNASISMTKKYFVVLNVIPTLFRPRLMSLKRHLFRKTIEMRICYVWLKFTFQNETRLQNTYISYFYGRFAL